MLYNGNIQLFREIMAKRETYEDFSRHLEAEGLSQVSENGEIKVGPPPSKLLEA